LVQIFAKRFWGFSPQSWPIISFGLEANRDALIKASQPGDLIAFIGTQTEPTIVQDQGRVLGLAEIGRLPIDSLDVLDRAALTSESFTTSGEFKWPKSLPMLRAWLFPSRPRVIDTFKEQLSYEATVRAVLLDAEDHGALLKIPREAVALSDAPIIKQQRELAFALSFGATHGPPPTSWSGEVSKDASAAALTYALRFGKRDLWKIGYAQDVNARLADINKHVPHEVINEHWTSALTQKWPSQTAAYEMEQRVLALLTKYRTVGERVGCTEHELQNAWINAMMGRTT
jgi:hypothetical protein